MLVAQHHGVRRQHLADGGHGRFGLAFLDEADDGIDQDHAQNHGGVDAMTQRAGDRGRNQQQVDQNIVELQQEAHERPASLRGA